MKTLDFATYRDKVAGCWAGKNIGGVLGAPFGAWAAKHVPAKWMLILVGTVLSITSAYGVWTAWLK